MLNNITLYTQNNCPACVSAKALLDGKGFVYTVKNVSSDSEARKFLLDRGLRSVPQIVIDGMIIEGLNGLKAYLERG